MGIYKTLYTQSWEVTQTLFDDNLVEGKLVDAPVP